MQNTRRLLALECAFTRNWYGTKKKSHVTSVLRPVAECRSSETVKRAACSLARSQWIRARGRTRGSRALKHLCTVQTNTATARTCVPLISSTGNNAELYRLRKQNSGTAALRVPWSWQTRRSAVILRNSGLDNAPSLALFCAGAGSHVSGRERDVPSRSVLGANHASPPAAAACQTQ